MNRVEFIREIGKRTGYSQKDVKAVLEAAETLSYEEMAKGESVKMFSSLTLEGKMTSERAARNPKTGEEITVAPRMLPRAKFGAVAKRIVRGEAE